MNSNFFVCSPIFFQRSRRCEPAAVSYAGAKQAQLRHIRCIYILTRRAGGNGGTNGAGWEPTNGERRRPNDVMVEMMKQRVEGPRWATLGWGVENRKAVHIVRVDFGLVAKGPTYFLGLVCVPVSTLAPDTLFPHNLIPEMDGISIDFLGGIWRIIPDFKSRNVDKSSGTPGSSGPD